MGSLRIVMLFGVSHSTGMALQLRSFETETDTQRVRMISSGNVIEMDVYRLLSSATLFDRCKRKFHNEIL